MQMQLTRRQLVTWLGLTALTGVSRPAWSAGSPADALWQILRDSNTKLEKERRAPSAAAPAHGAPPLQSKAFNTPAEIWADLLEGNRRFVAGKPKARPLIAAREQLSEGQHPQVIILGCADSRVSPELVFDKNLGELFVVRTAGNVADPIALGSLEYAAEHLHSKVLVILGHEKCGAVAAAVAGAKMATSNLDAIVNKISPVIEKLRGHAQGEQLIRLAVEENVRQSARDIVEHSPILQQQTDGSKLTIISAVYRLESGAVEQLA